MDRGVKRLSQANMALALLLLAFVLAAGPTFELLAGSARSLGRYLAVLGPLSNWVGREDLHFVHDWTIFYWAWWLSWAPCVGMFIARISRGRTVRSLVGGMLVVPLLLETLWFNTFGGTGLSLHLGGATGIVEAVQGGQPNWRSSGCWSCCRSPASPRSSPSPSSSCSSSRRRIPERW